MAARISRNPAGQLAHHWRPAATSLCDDDARRLRAGVADLDTVRNAALHAPHSQAAISRLQRTIGNKAVQVLLHQRRRDDCGD